MMEMGSVSLNHLHRVLNHTTHQGKQIVHNYYERCVCVCHQLITAIIGDIVIVFHPDRIIGLLRMLQTARFVSVLVVEHVLQIAAMCSVGAVSVNGAATSLSVHYADNQLCSQISSLSSTISSREKK